MCGIPTCLTGGGAAHVWDPKHEAGKGYSRTQGEPLHFPPGDTHVDFCRPLDPVSDIL